MKNTIKMVLASLLVLVGASGCATNYVAKDNSGPQIKQYGVVVDGYRLYDGRKNPLSEQQQKIIKAALESDIVAAFQKKGISAKVVPANELEGTLKRYAELPRSGTGIKNPGTHNLSDQQEAFSRLGIDGLVIVTGESVIHDTSLIGLIGATAITTAQALAAGYAVPSGGVDAITTMEMSVIGANGSIRHHYGDRHIFSKSKLRIGQKKGDVINAAKRQELVEVYVYKYLAESGL